MKNETRCLVKNEMNEWRRVDFERRMCERQRVDILPPPPPAPGEQGRRRASFFDRHRPSANRGSSDAKGTTGDIDTATPPTTNHARGSSEATSTMGAVDTATPPTTSHACGGRTAHVGQREIGVEDTTPPAPQNVAPNPLPVSQRAIGVGNTTPPVSQRAIGIGNTTPPPKNVA